MALINIGVKQHQSMLQELWQKDGADDNTSAIKQEEKHHIKNRALEAGIIEPIRPLALHNSLMIAKIMRFEFPQDWYFQKIP